MKKNIKKFLVLGVLFVILAVGILFVISNQHATDGNFVINAHFQGSNWEGKKVILCTGRGSSLDYTPIDSAIIHQGKVRFQGEEQGQQLYTLRFYEDDSRNTFTSTSAIPRPCLPLFMGAESVSITANIDSLDNDLYCYRGPYDYYQGLKVRGSRSALQYIDYNRGKTRHYTAYASLMEPYDDFVKRRSKSPLKEGVDLLNTAQEALENYENYRIAWALKHASELVGVYVFYDDINIYTRAQIDAFMDAVPEKIREVPAVNQTLALADEVKLSAVGTKFRDFIFSTPDNKEFKISDYAGKGDYCLLDFWASWCKPCRAEIPHLKEAYNAYEQYGFKIISVSVDTDSARWKSAVEQEKMRWPQGIVAEDQRKLLGQTYNFRSIPTCILLGPDGTILHRGWRGSYMDRDLVKFYGQHFQERWLNE